MPRPFTTAMLELRARLTSTDGWVWLLECPVAGGGGVYRLCDGARPLLGDDGSGAGPRWYVPTTLAIDVPREGSDGAIGELTVTLPSVARVAVAELEARRIQGQVLTVRAERLRALPTFEGVLAWRHRVLRATAGETGVQLTCGHPAQLQRLPRRVFDGSVAPLYTTTTGGAIG